MTPQTPTGPRAHPIIVGLSHQTAPIEVREQVSGGVEANGDLLRHLMERPVIREVAVLSTCNRVEVYATSPHPDEASETVSEFLQSRAPATQIAPHLYRHRDAHATKHLFRVASSLDSLVVGEAQILGQLKQAFQVAADSGTARGFLHRCFERSLFVAKRVRTETGLAQGSVSVSSIAVELARKVFGDLNERTVLLLGAGEMAELTAQNLKKDGAHIHMVGRHAQRSEAAAQRVGVDSVPPEELDSALLTADVVISSTSAREPVLTESRMREVVKRRKHRPLFLIDIAVPRDIEPAVGDLNNTYLFDMDDLQRIAQENMEGRREEAQRAECIVEEEARLFEQWRESLDAQPTILALREQVRSSVDTELGKTLPRLSSLSTDERKALEHMAQSIVNRVLHGPVTQLKGSCGDPDLIHTTRRLFGINDVAADVESSGENK